MGISVVDGEVGRLAIPTGGLGESSGGLLPDAKVGTDEPCLSFALGV